jgi:short-subunit dehydrogenase
MVLTKLVLPEIIKTPGALIVNISSIAGKMGMAESSAYSAAKFGLRGFTEALFEEVREYGVKVSAICPGYVDTPLIPNRKALMREEMIRPEDIANAVEFILDSSPSACPVEITIRPQKSPFRK